MNVAYHLEKLGTPSALITRVGRDQYGKDLVALLSGSGLSTQYIQEDREHATGLVYAKVGEHHEVTYDIVFPSAWDFIEWQDEFSRLLEGSEYFIFGSLASRHNVSRDTLHRLLEVARKKVLDINLRPPHFTQPGVEYLLQKADVLKMNGAELEQIAGWYGQYNSTEDRIKHLQDRFNIETLIVTMGGDGALVMEEGALYRHGGFKVKVQDTIGSGDAFLAGFVHQKLRGTPVDKALEFASAMGAFVATQPGACPDYEVTQVASLINTNPSATL